MAENKPGVMIYFETLQAMDALDAEDTKQILGAILRYARDGESPAFQGTLAALWFLIQSGLDRDGNRYSARRMRGLWLTYCRKCKDSGIESLSFEEWETQQSVNDTLSCVERPVEQSVEQSVDAPSPTTSPSPTASPTPTTSPSPTASPTPASIKREYREGCGERKSPASDWMAPSPGQSGAAAPTPSGVASRKQYGKHGWVRLTDDEYARLLDELGEAELQRCITYIDESAQMNGNKNKWRDWNLVIRKCSRERWGIRNGSGSGNGGRQSASVSAMDDLQQLHQLYSSESWEGDRGE